MRAIIKEVGKVAKVEDIKNELTTMQELVGGYIEAVNTGQGICLVVNEEGKLQELPQNFPIGNDVIVGTAVFVAYGKDGEFTDLTDEQIDIVMNFFEGAKMPMTENEMMIVAKIVRRAEKMNLVKVDRHHLMMDIVAVNQEVGLRLEEWLNADEFNFAHDVVGIQQNLDPDTKKLTNFFLPRYAKGDM